MTESIVGLVQVTRSPLGYIREVRGKSVSGGTFQKGLWFLYQENTWIYHPVREAQWEEEIPPMDIEMQLGRRMVTERSNNNRCLPLCISIGHFIKVPPVTPLHPTFQPGLPPCAVMLPALSCLCAFSHVVISA